MTPTLLTFCDVHQTLRYINLNNVEVIRFEYVPNSLLERICIRFISGDVFYYEIQSNTADIIKKQLKSFTLL